MTKMPRRLFPVLVCLLCILALFAAPLQAQTKPADTPAEAPVDSDDELRRAIQSSGGSEQAIVVNLEEYLKRFPRSARREMLEKQIYKLAVKLKDRERVISYAGRLLAADAADIDALTTLITTLRERRGPGDLEQSLRYADQLVKQFETIVADNPKPKRVSAARWQEQKDQGSASVFLLRGKVLADLGQDEKAVSDLQKSFKLYKLGAAALTLGEIAERRKNVDEAIDLYAQAFVIGLVTNEDLDLKKLRGRLGQIYVAKHKSEAGLGDRILKLHDAYVRDREERAAKIDRPNPNEGLTDPMAFTLTNLDGSPLRLSDHRGKVIVMNFWATWCGPCLTEMPLFEKTVAKYKDDKQILFLAVNTDEDRELVAPFMKQYKFNLPVAYADYLDYHFVVNSIPTTIILDPKGQVSYRQAGFMPGDDFVSLLSGKIDEAKKK
ncbi:MAG: redoxin family protein [Blastocatellia bacterium]|nr:redoxin family protein [Blastocatellia bacterium]